MVDIGSTSMMSEISTRLKTPVILFDRATDLWLAVHGDEGFAGKTLSELSANWPMDWPH